MKRIKNKVFAGFLIVALLFAGAITSCAGRQAQVPDRVKVAVTIVPQADFVMKVGGDRVDVTVMVPPGASPHTYEPSPSQIVALAGAVMYAKVGSGIDFELAWMDRLVAANRDMLVVDCSEGIGLIESTDDDHEGMDPHIWTSPLNVQVMVSNITGGLVKVDPAGKDYYERNRDAYLGELRQLDGEIRQRLSGVEKRTMMVLHPAFGYFAYDYDLNMLSIEVEGKEPTPAALARIIEEGTRNDIRVIFASPQFNPQSAQVVADAIGARVVLIDPLGGDYLGNMRILVDELVRSLE